VPEEGQVRLAVTPSCDCGAARCDPAFRAITPKYASTCREHGRGRPCSARWRPNAPTSGWAASAVGQILIAAAFSLILRRGLRRRRCAGAAWKPSDLG